jgi:GNAT superfamily N-acetyltransferase
MSIYYVDCKRAQKYDMTNIGTIGDKTIEQLRSDISSIPNFCREETSIEVADLKGYIGGGITLYSLNSETLSGVINFDINVDKINVSGLCVPGPSTGVGTQLINAVKTFAELNGIKTINLTCYGSVVDFYTRNGFRIQSQRTVKDDSDDDSDDEDYEPKTRYDMSYAVISGGKRTKTSRRKNKTKKNRTKKNRKARRKSRRYH